MDDLVDRALAEDVGGGDVTTEATVPADARARATITQKAPGAVYGLDVAEAVFRRLDSQVRVGRLVEEGVWRGGGGRVMGGGGWAGVGWTARRRPRGAPRPPTPPAARSWRRGGE